MGGNGSPVPPPLHSEVFGLDHSILSTSFTGGSDYPHSDNMSQVCCP